MKVLMVGCGGIGVELLNCLQYVKQLKELHLIDMDTVELSNLSRQYIFTPDDIGKLKTDACKRFFTSIRPDVLVESHPVNVFTCNLKFFMSFDYVINALDNIQARTHVSKQVFTSVLMQQKPVLIDAGTSGLAGSVSVYQSVSQPWICCRSQVVDAPVPVCTLRQKPESAKHCIIYAKYFIDRLGGAENELVEFGPLADQTTDDIKALYNRVFGAELPDSAFHGQQAEKEEDLQFAIPTTQQAQSQFVRFIQFNSASKPFDKNDPEHITALGAIAALRCFQFNIQPVTPFEAVGIASRIVPAVSYANGAVAAIAVDTIMKLINKEKVHNSFVDKRSPYVFGDEMERKTKTCEFCSQRFVVDADKSKYISEYHIFDGERCVNDDSDWFGASEEVELEEHKIYAAVRGDEKVFVVFGHESRLLQEAQIIEAERQDKGEGEKESSEDDFEEL